MSLQSTIPRTSRFAASDRLAAFRCFCCTCLSAAALSHFLRCRIVRLTSPSAIVPASSSASDVIGREKVVTLPSNKRSAVGGAAATAYFGCNEVSYHDWLHKEDERRRHREAYVAEKTAEYATLGLRGTRRSSSGRARPRRRAGGRWTAARRLRAGMRPRCARGCSGCGASGRLCIRTSARLRLCRTRSSCSSDARPSWHGRRSWRRTWRRHAIRWRSSGAENA